MSGFLAGKVWQSGLKGTLKPLAACLADIADNDGTNLFPSIEHITWLLGCKERSVQVGMAELRAAGIITPVKNQKGGRGRLVHYQFNEENLPKRLSWKAFKKGAESAPFIGEEKGASVCSERVHSATVKGANSCISPYRDPSLDPSSLPVERARPNSKPRKPGSFDERNDKSPKFGIELIRVLPDEWLEATEAAMREKFPALSFGEVHGEWCIARTRDGSIGKFNCRVPTLVQYSADIEIFFSNWNRNHNGQNGNGKNGFHKSTHGRSEGSGATGSEVDESIWDRASYG